MRDWSAGTMPVRAPGVVPHVVQQHVEEAAVLRGIRAVLVRAPHVKLHHLRRLDERLAAHLDGILVAGDYGRAACIASLENPQGGQIFTAAVRAIEDGDLPGINRLLALSEAMPELQSGFLSAAGWVSGRFLQGVVRDLLGSSSPFHTLVGISACAMHQVDPGDTLERALHAADRGLRARALRCAGESGRRDLMASCMLALDDKDLACRLWAARSAVLLGDRGRGMAVLAELALLDEWVRPHALLMALKLADPAQANGLLKPLLQDPASLRLLVKGCGMSGDASYVPWLIGQMDNPGLCRLAGDALAMITGLDVSLSDLDGRPPEDLASGPSDDPADEDVAMDEDDGLPWPDPAKIRAWWQGELGRFTHGQRYFMGEAVTPAHCRKVLREGCQRQRSAAAEYLCLMEPGIRLFPTSAPAWRQERWLGRMA
jgi:uncharacterized protein (TIGR02270 family)